MKSCERVATLLNREIPDQMGVFEHFWFETLGDYWSAQGYPRDADPAVYFDYDMAPVPYELDTVPFSGVQELIEETDEWVITRDGCGATLKTWKNRSGTPEHIGFEATTPQKWRKFRQPLREVNPKRLGDLDKIRKSLDEIRSRGKSAIFSNMFVFELMRKTIGDEHFLPALLLEPDWIHDFCRVYLDFYRNHYEILFREVGLPDLFWISEDLGFSNGLFCSPQVLAELIMPYHKQLVSFFKDYHLPVVLHTCGDIRKAIGLIIDAGYDCLEPMEAKAGCDVIEIAKTYGRRISYMGNIDAMVLNTNNPAAVEAEIVPKLKKLKEMRIPYFFHSDHSIPPDIHFKTYEYALRLFRDNCRY